MHLAVELCQHRREALARRAPVRGEVQCHQLAPRCSFQCPGIRAILPAELRLAEQRSIGALLQVSHRAALGASVLRRCLTLCRGGREDDSRAIDDIDRMNGAQQSHSVKQPQS